MTSFIWVAENDFLRTESWFPAERQADFWLPNKWWNPDWNTQQQLNRLLNAVKAGFDPSIIAEEANALKDQLKELEVKIKHAKNNPPHQSTIDEEEIKSFFMNFSTTLKNAKIEERRKLLRTFTRQNEFDPKKKEVRVQFYPDNVVHRIGAAGGTWTPTPSRTVDFESTASAIPPPRHI